MLKLESISFNNFRSIRNGQVVFPENGILLLRGKSGAGKSSVGLGIAYALDFCPFSATDLVTRGQKNGGVELKLSGTETIVRKKQGSTFGSLTSSKEIQSKIKETFKGVDSDIIRALTYNQQNDQTDFLTLDSSKRYDVLFSLFPELKKLAEEGDKASITHAEILKENNSAELNISFLEKQQKDRESLISTQKEQIKFVQDICRNKFSKRDALKIELEKLLEELNTKKELYKFNSERPTELKEAFNALKDIDSQKPVVEVSSFELQLKLLQTDYETTLANQKSKINTINKETEKIVTSVTSLLQQARREFEYRKSDRISIEEKKNKLESGVCYTCHQQWCNEMEIDRLRETIATYDREFSVFPEVEHRYLKQIEDAKIQGNQAVTAVEAEFDPRLKELQEKIFNLTTEINKIRSGNATELQVWSQKRAIINDKFQNLKNQHESAVRNMEKDLVNLNSSIFTVQENIKSELKEIESQLKLGQNLMTTLNSHEELFKSEHEKIINYKQKFSENQQKEKIEKTISTILSKNGFLGKYLVDILEEISVETNTFLSRIENTKKLSIQFGIESTAARQSITVRVTEDGIEAPLLAGTSGGQYSSIRLAVRFGLRNVLSRRTGLNLGWIFLDESFNGLGASDKESCLEILKEVGRDTLVVVVDHDNQFSSYFDQVLEVRLEEEGTKFVLIN